MYLLLAVTQRVPGLNTDIHPKFYWVYLFDMLANVRDQHEELYSLLHRTERLNFLPLFDSLHGSVHE